MYKNKLEKSSVIQYNMSWYFQIVENDLWQKLFDKLWQDEHVLLVTLPFEASAIIPDTTLAVLPLFPSASKFNHFTATEEPFIFQSTSYHSLQISPQLWVYIGKLELCLFSQYWWVNCLIMTSKMPFSRSYLLFKTI